MSGFRLQGHLFVTLTESGSCRYLSIVKSCHCIERDSETEKFCSFKFEVRQNMLQISNSLQRERHFCFDANPYPTGRRGLRRNRNVWRATSSELSHFELESTFRRSSHHPTDETGPQPLPSAVLFII